MAEHCYAVSFMLSFTYAECHLFTLYAECHYAECHYAECHYAECHYAECRGANRPPVQSYKTFFHHKLWFVVNKLDRLPLRNLSNQDPML